MRRGGVGDVYIWYLWWWCFDSCTW